MGRTLGSWGGRASARAHISVCLGSRAHRRAAPRGFAGARADHTARSGRRRFALSRRSDSASQRSTCRFRAGRRRRAARPNVERATRRARVRPDRSIHFSVDISTDIGSKNPQQSKLRAFAGTSKFVSSPPLDHCPTRANSHSIGHAADRKRTPSSTVVKKSPARRRAQMQSFATRPATRCRSLPDSFRACARSCTRSCASS